MSSHKPRRTNFEVFARANLPGVYRCQRCGEVLSGPARLYTGCPGPTPVRREAPPTSEVRAA